MTAVFDRDTPKYIIEYKRHVHLRKDLFLSHTFSKGLDDLDIFLIVAGKITQLEGSAGILRTGYSEAKSTLKIEIGLAQEDC